MQKRVLKGDPGELGLAWELSQEYAKNDETFEEFEARFRDYPDLFIGCFHEGRLIGEASGLVWDEERVCLYTIGVASKFQRHGLGKDLLSLFEIQAVKRRTRITLASEKESDGFYLKMGYRPERVLLQVANGILPANYRDLSPLLIRERDAGDKKMLYFKSEGYDPGLRDSLEVMFKADYANIIFERDLAGA